MKQWWQSERFGMHLKANVGSGTWNRIKDFQMNEIWVVFINIGTVLRITNLHKNADDHAGVYLTLSMIGLMKIGFWADYTAFFCSISMLKSEILILRNSDFPLKIWKASVMLLGCQYLTTNYKNENGQKSNFLSCLTKKRIIAYSEGFLAADSIITDPLRPTCPRVDVMARIRVSLW